MLKAEATSFMTTQESLESSGLSVPRKTWPNETLMHASLEPLRSSSGTIIEAQPLNASAQGFDEHVTLANSGILVPSSTFPKKSLSGERRTHHNLSENSHNAQYLAIQRCQCAQASDIDTSGSTSWASFSSADEDSWASASTRDIYSVSSPISTADDVNGGQISVSHPADHGFFKTVPSLFPSFSMTSGHHFHDQAINFNDPFDLCISGSLLSSGAHQSMNPQVAAQLPCWWREKGFCHVCAGSIVEQSGPCKPCFLLPYNVLPLPGQGIPLDQVACIQQPCSFTDPRHPSFQQGSSPIANLGPGWDDTVNTTGCREDFPGVAGSHSTANPAILQITIDTGPSSEAAGQEQNLGRRTQWSNDRNLRPRRIRSQGWCTDDDQQKDQSGKQERLQRPKRSRCKDKFLVNSKLSGLSYKDIKEQGNFSEAESTLRGRFRMLTKEKNCRVRRPEWKLEDVAILRQAVWCFTSERIWKERAQCPSIAAKDIFKRSKIPWQKVAEYIASHGGSYHFGNATCRRKWDEIQAA